MITSIIKALKILNSQTEPQQIALAVVLGVVAAFGLLSAPHVLMVFVCALILKINLSTFFLTYGLIALSSFLLDPLIIMIGEWLLTHKLLTPYWVLFYQSDVMRLLQFNHTHTLGSFSLALILCLPTYYFSYWLVVHYRQNIFQWINRLRIIKALKSSQWYQRASTLYQATEG